MTFSIVGRSAEEGLLGVAVASKFLAVGAAVPCAEAEVGAVATQAFANLSFGPQAMAMLRTGVSASSVVAGLVASDPGRAQRQFGVVAADGGGATYTGDECPNWSGGRAGENYAVQGNILTGPDVVDAMRDAWIAGAGTRCAERLLEALRAGDDAGGDRRGRQSAALLVMGKNAGYGGTSDIAVSLRVDDHRDPVDELDRLLQLHRLYFDKPSPDEVIVLSREVVAEVEELLGRLGHSGEMESALHSWAGIANLEERLVEGHIDPLVLAHLRREAAAAEPEE